MGKVNMITAPPTNLPTFLLSNFTTFLDNFFRPYDPPTLRLYDFP